MPLSEVLLTSKRQQPRQHMGSYRRKEVMQGDIVHVEETRRSIIDRSHLQQITVAPNDPSALGNSKIFLRSQTEGLYSRTRVQFDSFPSKMKAEMVGHVTYLDKLDPGRFGKTVVIHQSKPQSDMDDTYRVFIGDHSTAKGLSFAPLAPRVARLPTPNIVSVEDNPFCDCCEILSKPQYCTYCGVSLGNRCDKQA